MNCSESAHDILSLGGLSSGWILRRNVETRWCNAHSVIE